MRMQKYFQNPKIPRVGLIILSNCRIYCLNKGKNKVNRCFFLLLSLSVPGILGEIPYSNDCFLRVLTQMPNEWRRRGLLHFPVIAWSCGVQTQGQLVGKCPTLASCSGFKFPKVAHCLRRLMVSMCPMEIFPSSEQSDRTAIAIRSTCNCRSVDWQLPFGLLAIAVR